MENKKVKSWILRIICLLPILFWPIIFYGTIFIFDDPSANHNHQLAAFYGINSYPIFIIILLLIANKLYKKKNKLSIALYFLPITLLAIGIIFLAF